MPVISCYETERIHNQSPDLLERVGIDFLTPKALAVVGSFGCQVDYDRTWSSIPRELVEWALQQASRIVHVPT